VVILPSVATLTIGIESLLLDPENPRHGEVATQADAIRAIIGEQRGKLVNLAEDIIVNGLSPLDRFLVMKTGKTYTVLEGNRRIAALKLLHNADLAAGTAIERDIKKLAGRGSAPREVDCALVGSREEAKHWLTLRHNGEQEGRGVVDWSAVASARFSAAPGSRESKWLAFIDAVQAAYPENAQIQEAIDTIESGRLTTLGRLYSDPDFRDYLGIDDGDGGLQSHYPASALEATLQRVLGDLASDLSVTKIKSKEQRAEYLSTLPKPKKASYQTQAAPLTTAIATTALQTANPAAGSSTTRRSRQSNPFKGLDLRQLDQRIDGIVRELQKLDVEKFPNAAAVLSRVLLELSMDQYIAKKKLTLSKQNPKLKDKLKRCLREVDPTDKAAEYQGVRAGLNDNTSIYSVATLHGYVHNKDFHPTPSDVRGIVANLRPLLQNLNDSL
jgi:hypothetical protein